jgi:hypothetical protein
MTSLAMASEPYRIRMAMMEIRIEICATYENIGKSSQEIEEIVRNELYKNGGTEAMGSQLLWVNYVKKDIMKNVLNTLGLS